MPSIFCGRHHLAEGGGGDVGARHEALGSDAMRVEKEKVGRKEGAGTGSGKREGRRDRGRDREKGEGRSERGGWVKRGERGGQIKYRQCQLPAGRL